MTAPAELLPAVVERPQIEPLRIVNLATGESVDLALELTAEEACHRHVNVDAAIAALRAYQSWCEQIIGQHMETTHATRMFADGVVYKFEAGTTTIVDQPQLLAGLQALAADGVIPASELEKAIIRPEPAPPPPPKVHLGKLKTLLKYGDRVAEVVSRFKRDEPTPPRLAIERVTATYRTDADVALTPDEVPY